MAIKKLQNNFTTPEQSKRLLELGVPADSADCYYLREHPDRLCILNDGKTLSKLRLQMYMAHAMPCWSVGRLIEIAHLCGSMYYTHRWINAIPIDSMMRMYETHAKDFDFSKLEERIMKPDGTHTVAELAEMARAELQSWERIELAQELADMSELLQSCTIRDIDMYTPYYAYEEERESASEQEIIEDASSMDLARELIDRGDMDIMLDHMDIETDIIPYLEDKGYEIN